MDHELTRQLRDPHPDARTERWREHRLRVRADFVDAAFRALDEYGPEASMGDIAKTAGAAKPKLYRHFSDKSDLHKAIVDRIADLLWDRILSSISVVDDPVAELIRRVAAEYALVVTEHPNVFRFLMHGRIARAASDSEPILQAVRRAARRTADLLAAVTDGAVEVDGAELVIYSSFGAVAAATAWWIGPYRPFGDPGPAHVMPIEEFVGYLAAIITGLAQTSARCNGIALDVGAPLPEAFGRV